MKRRKYEPEIVRAWSATVTYKGDPAGYRKITTTVHGPNPTTAQDRYIAEHPDVATVILHQELR